MAKRIDKNQDGFTLIEVMIAMTIFAVFVTAIILSQTANINNSIRMAQDLVLHNLAELKMNEVQLSPPTFTNATENQSESKNFEIEGYKKYKYTIDYKKLEFPDFAQLTGEKEEEEKKDSRLRKAIYEKMKKNIEEMLWQVKVTIVNTETEQAYELNSWITNKKAKIDTNFAF